MKQKKSFFLPKGNWTRMLFSLVLFMVLTTGMAFAQQKTITGKVTDDSGSSIPGVSIIVKGTTTGTVTDIDGQYSLNVPANAEILSFGFVGMISQDVPIGQRTVVNAVMKTEITGVDEVVVVGYGTQQKKSLSGAVSTVSAKQMLVSSAPSAVGRLQGKVSGVTITNSNTPGGEATIRVRGLGTINDNEPLYVIDGVPSGAGNNLNPNDIESVSVLKDASSAAIYGTRGANGVILITTKRGRIGDKPTLSLNVRTGMSNAVNQYSLLNTREYGEMLWLEAKNMGVAPNNPLYGTGVTPKIPDYILPAGAMEGAPGADPSLYKYPSYLIQKANKQGTNWYDEIYRTGIIQDYDLSVSGGSEKSSYAFSGGYLNQEGYLIHTGFERYSFRSNTDAIINDWLKVGQSLAISYTQSQGNQNNNGEGVPISQAYRNQPIIPVYDIMGNFAGSKAPSLGNSSNPVADLTRGQNDYGKNFRALGNFFAEITLMKGLTFKSLLGYNYNQANGKWVGIPNPEHSEAQMVASVHQWSNYSMQWNWANTVNFSKTFAGIHKISAVVGTEAIQNKYEWEEAGKSQYFSTDFDYMQLSTGETNPTNAGSGSEWGLFSIFGRVNYDLKSKYLLEATIRRDGSSRFGLANRYGIFPAASGAWILTGEDFMAGTSNWLSFMKLRAGWGLSGNDRIGEYQTYSTFGINNSLSAYDINGANTSKIQGFQPNTYGNPDVTWEKTATVNLGMDVQLFNNSITLGLDVWQRNTSDMLYRIARPYVSGTATHPFVNVGSMTNKGIDFELGYRNKALGGKFTYNVTATVSAYKNEITKLSGNAGEAIVTGSLRQVNYSRAEVGTAFPEFYGYIVDGIFQTKAEADAHPKAFGEVGTYNKPGHFKYRDVNDDKVINSKDMTYIGSPHPDFTGGLNIDLAYGNFDMNMVFYGSYGNEMINYVRRWIDYSQFLGNRSHDRLYNSWGSPYLTNNANAKLPMADTDEGSQQASSHFVEDASYLRMKSFQIGYNLPKTILSRLSVQNLRIYGQVTNIFTLTKYSGLDPEFNSSGEFMGLDQGAWPTPRQVMFGIRLTL